MEPQYTYFLILIASVIGPVALSFDNRVKFNKKWETVFKAMLLPALFFITWDIIFTAKAVWSFNPIYITGFKIINLPIEEILFFFIVPFSCLFIYECIRVYFKNLKNQPKDDLILKILAVILIIAGIYFHAKLYTSVTFILCGLFILFIYTNKKIFKYFDATSFIISYSVMLIPFLIVNGYLTSIPVVLYNKTQNLGIKISTIPLEDVVYGMLLMLMNVALYERIKNNGKWKRKQKKAATIPAV